MGLAITLRLDRNALKRWVAAGSAWGLTLAAFFFALDLRQCGLPCPADLVFTTMLCVGTGIATIGPLAAFAHSK
jgi:hypothetical protein